MATACCLSRHLREVGLLGVREWEREGQQCESFVMGESCSNKRWSLDATSEDLEWRGEL